MNRKKQKKARLLDSDSDSLFGVRSESGFQDDGPAASVPPNKEGPPGAPPGSTDDDDDLLAPSTPEPAGKEAPPGSMDDDDDLLAPITPEPHGKEKKDECQEKNENEKEDSGEEVFAAVAAPVPDFATLLALKAQKFETALDSGSYLTGFEEASLPIRGTTTRPLYSFGKSERAASHSST